MKMLKTIAVSAILLTGVSTAFAANPYNVNGGLTSLEAIDNANFATVLKVNDAEANNLRFDNDMASIQQRIKNNPFLANQVINQGYTIDQIVGVDGDVDGGSVTFYAL